MVVNREHYLGILLECILFEFAAYTDQGYFYELSFDLLASTFEEIATISRSGRHFLNIPCDIYIYNHGLDETYNLSDLIDDVNEYGELFPLSCDYDGWTISVPGLHDSEIQEFLWNYTENVPTVYQDDIAALLYDLRSWPWDINGSGGVAVQTPDGVWAIEKFTAVHNQAKLARAQEKERRELEQQRLRREEEERWRLEEQRRQQEEQRRQYECIRLSRLNSRMHNLARQIMSSEDEKSEVAQVADTVLCDLGYMYPHCRFSVHLLGSFANGLSERTSDCDLTVLDPGQQLTIHKLAQVLRKLGCTNVVTIPYARVPIVSFEDKHWGIPCDISINEPLGIENSKLISTYCKIDNRLRIIWFTLKRIAKSYGILSAKKGFLSSYALTLMLITYLQTIKTPILPALQQQPERRLTHKNINGVYCSFDRNWSNYVAAAQENMSKPADLILSFLKYFGYTFIYSTWEVNCRLGQIRQDGQRNTREDMRVMDPFLVNRNVTSMVRGGNVGKIRAAFQSAYESLNNDEWDLGFS
ncbi:hypothetical protein EDD11_007821 [Mortierella claussenii]|nr:hypothetical protein EDD11_007821 [Mortierella claussenii]